MLKLLSWFYRSVFINGKATFTQATGSGRPIEDARKKEICSCSKHRTCQKNPGWVRIQVVLVNIWVVNLINVSTLQRDEQPRRRDWLKQLSKIWGNWFGTFSDNSRHICVPVVDAIESEKVLLIRCWVQTIIDDRLLPRRNGFSSSPKKKESSNRRIR